EQTLFLRNLARRTWAFFESFVGAEDHGLPPDNFQEHPAAVVAHRTSPTNMGLALLANLSAYDFGYIPAGRLIARTADALATMNGMERYEGHFYNWYDTQSLKPLAPLYVSAVDSGNLAAHLMTLRPGLLALADDRIIEPRWFEGLADTLRTLAEALGEAAPASLARLRGDLDTAYDAWPATLAIARQWLTRIEARIAEVTQAVAGTPAGEAMFWVDALARQCRAMQEELTTLAPGMKGEIPTLRELAALEAQSPEAGASHPATERMAE